MVDFYTNQLKKPVGGKVECVIKTEPDDFGDELLGLCIKVDGKELNAWFLMDDEGNGLGSFALSPSTA